MRKRWIIVAAAMGSLGLFVACAAMLVRFLLSGLVPTPELTLNEGFYATVQAGDIKTATDSLNHGADPNFRFDGEQTPLSAAVRLNNVEMARMLLQHHADPNLIVAGGTAFDTAQSAEMKALIREVGGRRSKR